MSSFIFAQANWLDTGHGRMRWCGGVEGHAATCAGRHGNGLSSETRPPIAESETQADQQPVSNPARTLSGVVGWANYGHELSTMKASITLDKLAKMLADNPFLWSCPELIKAHLLMFAAIARSDPEDPIYLLENAGNNKGQAW